MLKEDRHMKTFLFAHNPENWQWDNLDNAISDIETKGCHREKWSIISHKQVSVGNRAFLMRLGSKTPNKGIIGAGYVVTEPFLSEHWSGNGKMVNRVIIEFETLSKEPIISIQKLQNSLPYHNWTPQSSGIEIPETVASELEKIWFGQTLKTIDAQTSPNIYKEGSSKSALSTRYERNPYARLCCIEANGCSCKICGFNFNDTYGELGQDYIHVHHIVPISTIGEEYVINPKTDLIPVCPNCHAMLHKTTPPLKIEVLKQIIMRSK